MPKKLFGSVTCDICGKKRSIFDVRILEHSLFPQDIESNVHTYNTVMRFICLDHKLDELPRDEHTLDRSAD